jgi:hypothetical protein
MLIRRANELGVYVCVYLCLWALVACGSGKPAPKQPQPPDPKRIAADLHARMTEMAEITHRLREACPQMAGELRALFARMQHTVDEAKLAGEDPALAKQLTGALRDYDQSDRDLSGAIFSDLSACKDDAAVRDVMATMPTLPP